MKYVGVVGFSCLMLSLAGCASSTADREAKKPTTLVVSAAGSPKITIPSGPPPNKVVVEDLKVGTGARLGQRGDISTFYVAYDYETGKVRENLWRAGFDIHFGPGWQTRGWQIGMPGMRVGGIRKLIVPSRLAYKDGTIVYVVKLVGVK